MKADCRANLSGIESGKHNLALANICRLAETLAVPTPEMLDISRHDASQLQVEQSRAPFGNRQRAAIEATVHHMADLTEPELNLVAAVARALAGKGSFRPSLTHATNAASDAVGDNKD